MFETYLEELASLYGITIEKASEHSGQSNKKDSRLVSIFKAAGLPISKASEAENLLEQLKQQQYKQMLEPVLVVPENHMPLSLPVRFPENDTHRYKWSLTEESGVLHHGSFTPVDLAVDSCFETREGNFALYLLDLGITLPCGYHQFVIEDVEQQEDGQAASLLLIVAPEHCYVPPGIDDSNRVWGVSAHLHAIRSGKNWGIGDFSDLKQILAWAAERGAGTVHIPPLHSVSFESSGFLNPYAPSCRSRLNVLFIDVEEIVDLAECGEAQNFIKDARFQARLANLRNRDQVDYDAVFRIKEELFKKLWDYFSTNQLNPETARGGEFRLFQKQGGDTLRFFAIFAVLLEEFRTDDLWEQDWRNWPAAFKKPYSDEVAEFARQHENEIEYHQYLQWQAEIQLAALGRRSMELGLKVGLLGEFPYGSGRNGFETWYYGHLLLDGGYVERNEHNGPVIDPAAGLPLFVPNSLKRSLYRPFIEALRQSMSHVGALFIRSISNYFQVYFSLTGEAKASRTFIRFPFSDLLGILALESRRNRCLLIADHIDLLPEKQQRELRQRNIFSTHVLFEARDDQGNWLDAADYPANSLISSSASFLVSLTGFWKGRDIAVKTAEQIFNDDAEKEKAVLSRASDRAHFLISLAHEGLLPEGYGLDPAAVPDIDQSLIRAGQILLARSPAKILLVSLNDLLGMENQGEPPGMVCQPFWQMRMAHDLDYIFTSQEIESLMLTLCQERGFGVVRSSASSHDRRKRQSLQIPSAFYRLQLHKGFAFQQAIEIIPYLKGLGISHCYVSPFLMARPGSLHGYDIINHASLNPEIGSREDFEKFIAALEQHQIALLLDIVPNHMGIGSDNQWWMDVLENGETSLYADFFDINWQPQQSDMAGRVLLPVLGDHYGKILESSRLALHFYENSGSFTIQYYEHRFPVDPKTYAAILNHDLKRLSDRLGKQHNGFLELQNLISSFDNLPDRQKRSDERNQVRQRDKEVSKRILARLCREVPEVRQFIEENVILFNGEPGKAESFDLLHELLEKQAYRLAFWRVATDEINYRRFFDINDLAGLRMEKKEVFRETHELVLDLIATGKVDGLRIDHPDGLYDPYTYFCRLQAASGGDLFDDTRSLNQNTDSGENIFLYVVAEKVLADFEHLPETWPVCGTTGYDFANLLNGLLIDTGAEKYMTSLYQKFINTRLNFDEIVYSSKKLIIRSALAGELNVLTSLLYRLAQASRSSRDFTLNRLRDVLTDVIACFPVYRTYIASTNIHKRDIQYIEWAIARARRRHQLQDLSIFDFIRSVLLLERTEKNDDLTKQLDFVLKLQQYTGPIMAKGLEDTAFYIYNRLLSLNEVGGDPKRFGVSEAAFHRINQERLHQWPHCMLNSSTHDSKRSEDVRARINVLTEMPQEWRKRVFRWHKLNQPLKVQLADMLAPTRNDEYAFYQNLLGAWPVGPLDEQGHQEFVERMKNSTLKACRESKINTSWINPNENYEKAIISFVEGALKTLDSPFMGDFISFQQDVSWFGMLNSLSQVFFKLVSPGIPDIYQGNEIWRFCLVDPDNRRAVDYQKRQAMLFPMCERIKAAGVEELQQELLANLSDGRAKMYIILRTLGLRNTWPKIFERGSYLPIEVTGSKSRHICAFARKTADRMIIVVAPRLYLTLMQGKKDLPLGEKVWDDTKIILPAGMESIKFENIYSDKRKSNGVSDKESPFIQVGRLLSSWPVALLNGKVH